MKAFFDFFSELEIYINFFFLSNITHQILHSSSFLVQLVKENIKYFSRVSCTVSI